MTQLNFNSAATQALSGRSGAKLRMEVRGDTMFIRPTDRKAGPHVLTEIKQHGKSGVSVTLEDKQVEKLAAAGILTDAAAFNVVADKYGWFALRAGTEGEEAANGAKATVSKKAAA